MPKFFRQKNNGYMILIGILVVGAIGIAITVSLLLLGLGTSKTSFAVEQSYQARALANECAEEALQHIRELTSFTGNDTLSFERGSCSYAVTSQGGENRTIEASGNVGSIVRKVKITLVDINPSIQITSWQELADF